MSEQESLDPAAERIAQMRRLDWFTRPEVIADRTGVRLVGGLVNLSYNALDRHVIRGRADELALITDESTYTHAQLLERVAQLGGALRELGVVVGDRVLIALPIGDGRIIAQLAGARVGAVLAFTSGDAAHLAAASDAARPKVVIGPARPQGEHRPDYCVISPESDVAELGPFDIALRVLMKPGSFQPAACAEVPADQAADVSGSESVGAQALRLIARAGVGPGSDVAATTDDDVLGVLLAGGTARLRPPA